MLPQTCLTYFGQVGHPVLVVEEVCPVHPLARYGSRYRWRQSQVRVDGPNPDRDRHTRVHHVQKQCEGVGFGVLWSVQIGRERTQL